MTNRTRHSAIVSVSHAACALCLVGVLPAAVFLPRLVEAYTAKYIPTSTNHVLPITALLYVGLAIAAAVLVLLLALLQVTRKGNIFTPVSGKLVLAVACLVMAEGCVFAGLSAFILPLAALAVAIVALVMGLCFLVVSHVLREAAIIKAENDGTI